MSDCRFGVSPVNYADSDPDHSATGAAAIKDMMRCAHWKVIFLFEDERLSQTVTCFLYFIFPGVSCFNGPNDNFETVYSAPTIKIFLDALNLHVNINLTVFKENWMNLTQV